MQLKTKPKPQLEALSNSTAGTGSLLMPYTAHEAQGYRIISLDQIEDILRAKQVINIQHALFAQS